ncbi:MAG: SusC/RagA family TonB-linked outer membrane protein [Gemmatimonadaceae bacterium]
MSSSRVRRMFAVVFALTAPVAARSALWAQQPAPAAQTSITGRVTERASSQPIADVRAVVVGRSIVAITNADGRYTLRGVPAGAVEVRVLRIGYAEQKSAVTVVAGQQSTLDFAMAAAPVQLSEVVTTAGGAEQRRLEVANDIAQIDASKIVQTEPIANMSDLLVARAPGVQVLPGNMTGTGARIRIRGTSSLSLGNDPIYVIDGVRMESSTGSSSISIGGSFPSRVNDINPNDIENIEIVKGPSAATLYGTDAANGVIVITTKHGRPGATKWNVFTEVGLIQDRTSYFSDYTHFGHTASGAVTSRCFNASVSAGTCTPDSLKVLNLFGTKDLSPIGNGNRQQYGVSVGGGTDAVRYFLSATNENEVGVLKVPDVEVARMNAASLPLLDEQRNPNALNRTSLRANINITLTPNTDVSVSTAYITGKQRLPQTDNNTTGILSNAYGGPGYRDNGLSTTGVPLNGYRRFTPADIFQETVGQSVNRFIGSVTPTWRPAPWLSTRANIGVDFTGRVDTDLCRRDNCSDFGTSREGFKVDNRTNFLTYTVDGSAAASFQPREWLSTKTTAGVQYFNNQFERNGASSVNLPPGTTTVNAGATQFGEELNTFSKTLGAYVEEQLGFRDRLFVTGALRADDNSAFGQNFKAAYYPKASVSWIVSDEPFFPRERWLNQLRLRTAYGSSGIRPGANDALRFFQPQTVNSEGANVPALQFQALGNPNLKPEKSTELEMGFDAKAFSNRIDLQLTYYNKRTKDALISRVLPPSYGSGDVSRFENLGAVRNTGWEALLSSQLVDRSRFAWDATLSGSTNSNTLVSLGGVPTIILGALNQDRQGYPLNGYWQRPILSYSDANRDGFITANELVVGDSLIYRGSSIPKYEAVLTNGFDFFGRRLRVQGLFDYKGGYKLLNDTERIRCQTRNNCSGLQNPKASLFEQARVVAMRDHSSKTQDGFIEDATFLRFRELSMTVQAPERLVARWLRASTASVTLSARNLHVWSKYTGLDPEANYVTGGFVNNDIPSDFQTSPPPTYFILRLNLGF